MIARRLHFSPEGGCSPTPRVASQHHRLLTVKKKHLLLASCGANSSGSSFTTNALSQMAAHLSLPDQGLLGSHLKFLTLKE